MKKDEPMKVIAGEPDRPLIIGDIEIPCYVLEDETRVFVQRGMASGLGMSNASGQRLTTFAASKSIKPFISKDLQAVIDNPIRFLTPNGIAHGYPAELFVELCKVILDARDAGQLTKQQEHIAERVNLLMRALAGVAIIALVDEATGYQRVREERALATILEKFIARELQPWTKTFPYEFYEQIFRLKNWPGPAGVKGPRVLGRYTNDIVYERLAPGVLEELRERNPVMSYGSRKNKHHQWFTPDLGHPKLKEHLAAVMALMRAAPNWEKFMSSLNRAFPKAEEETGRE